MEPEDGEITEDAGPAIDPALLGPARIGSPFEPSRLGSILGGGRARALFGLGPNSSDGETPQVAEDAPPTPELGDIPGLEDLESPPITTVEDADHLPRDLDEPAPEPDLDTASWPAEDVAGLGVDLPVESPVEASEAPTEAVETAEDDDGADWLVEAHLSAEAESVGDQVVDTVAQDEVDLPESEAAELSSEDETGPGGADDSEWMVEPDVAPVTVEASAALDEATSEGELSGIERAPATDEADRSVADVLNEAEADSDEVEADWDEVDVDLEAGDETTDEETEPVFEFFTGAVNVDPVDQESPQTTDATSTADTDIEVTSDDLVIMPSMEDLRAMAADLDDVDAILDRLDSDEDSVLAEIELTDTESADQALDLTPAE